MMRWKQNNTGSPLHIIAVIKSETLGKIATGLVKPGELYLPTPGQNETEWAEISFAHGSFPKAGELVFVRRSGFPEGDALAGAVFCLTPGTLPDVNPLWRNDQLEFSRPVRLGDSWAYIPDAPYVETPGAVPNSDNELDYRISELEKSFRKQIRSIRKKAKKNRISKLDLEVLFHKLEEMGVSVGIEATLNSWIEENGDELLGALYAR